MRTPLVVLSALVLLLLGCPVAGRDSSTLTAQYAGETLTITSQPGYVSLQMPGHWMYQPSLILYGAETAYHRIVLFNSNLNAYDQSRQAIWMAVDRDDTLVLRDPFPVLEMDCGICDMMDARPIYDGREWSVYVQARILDKNGACPPQGHIVRAYGPTLLDLRWDEIGGNIRPLVYGTGSGAGIGEDMQAFYDPASDEPYVLVYNDWGKDPPMHVDMHVAVSADNLTWRIAKVLRPAYDPWLERQGYRNTLVYPDALLEGTDILIGAQSSSFLANVGYQYSRVIALFHPAFDPQTFGLALQSMSYDRSGERMFRPRFGRDSRGRIPLSGVNRWDFIVLYNPTRVDSGTIDGYGRWNTKDQGLAFSTGRITK